MVFSFGKLVVGLSLVFSILDLVLLDAFSACVAARKAMDLALASSGYLGLMSGVESARFLGPDIAPVAAIKEPRLSNFEDLLSASGVCNTVRSFLIATFAAEFPHADVFGV